MTKWGVQDIDTYQLVESAGQTPCCLCGVANHLDAEFCRHCRAPMALALQANTAKSSLKWLAVLGPPGVGKSIYLGMLTDILSRKQGDLQVLARGAFSVSLQQQAISALARRQCPPSTPVEAEGWNWVHCEVADSKQRKSAQYLMPDISGTALQGEIENAGSVSVIQAFVSRCESAMILIDVEALERGDEEQDLLAMKSIGYLLQRNSHRRKGWPAQPIAFVFTKSDQNDACFEDPKEYARVRVPGLWRLCRERLSRYRFFATSVIGACAPVRVFDETVSIPLRVEPRGVEDPFIWLVQQVKKRRL